MESYGTKGKVVIENGILKWYALGKDERVICVTETGNTSKKPVIYREIPQGSKGTAHLGKLQNFTNAILVREELLAPGAEGIFGLSISNAAYLSDWTDSAVGLPMSEEQTDRFCALLKEKQEAETVRKARGQSKGQSGEYEERWSVNW